MKCQYCGANLQIEDAVCPHCGKENPHYIQHRSDMAAYRQDYQNTKEEVLGNAAALGRKTVRIAVIAVLVALCAVAAVFCFLGNNIRDAIEEQKVTKNKTVYEAKLQEYMRDADSISLYRYASRNHLTYSKAFDEYYKVFSAAMDYNYFYEYAMELVTEGTDNKYYTLEERCEDLARYVCGIYEARTKQSYDKDEYFTPDKAEYMDAAAEKTELLLKAYFGLSDDDIGSLPGISRSRLAILLEEGYKNEAE